jgi:ketosteroid isomerase-like protein
MDATATNVTVVQEIYEAFGRGDVPAILERLADDVEWDHFADNYAQRAEVPWLAARTGRHDVAGFFAILAGWTVREFDVVSLTAGDDHVAAEIRIDAEVGGGGRLQEEEVHHWTLDDAGQVTRFRHYTDTAKQIAAARGEDTTR